MTADGASKKATRWLLSLWLTAAIIVLMISLFVHEKAIYVGAAAIVLAFGVLNVVAFKARASGRASRSQAIVVILAAALVAALLAAWLGRRY